MNDKAKISAESATDIVQKWMDYYEIDLSEIENQAQRQAIDGSIAKVKKGVQTGTIEFGDGDDVCHITLHLKSGDKLDIGELDGRAKLEMGKRSVDDPNGKCYALIGSLSGVGFSAIADLKGPDLARVEALGVLFLLV